MIKAVLPVSLIVIFFTLQFSSLAHAESSVKVNINNSTGSSSDDNSSSDCSTNVKITVNGQTKTYDSADCNKDVHVQSDSGGSSVEVKNEGGGAEVEVNNNESATILEDTNPTPTKEAIKDIVKEHKEDAKKAIEKHEKSFLQNLIDSFFSFISFKKNE